MPGAMRLVASTGRVRAAIVGASLVATLASSCSPGNTLENTSGQPQNTGEDIAHLQLRAAASGLEMQEQILSDGIVEYVEYERATMAAIECYRDAGLDVVGPTVDSLGFLAFSYGGISDPDELNNRLVDITCEEDFLLLVSAAYAAQNAPTESEVADRTRSYAACLVEYGIHVEPSAGSAEMDVLAIDNGITDCIAAHSMTASVLTHGK